MSVVAPLDFAAKRALVLGVEAPAARALALALAEGGADVAAVAARDDPESAFAAKRVATQIAKLGRRSLSQAIDASLPSAVQVMTRQVSKELGGLDLLVACLDQPQPGPSLRLGEPEWAKLVALNLSALFFACRFAAREMAPPKASGGAILALLPQAGEGAAYAALKAAALALVPALAQELADSRVRLNALAFPGPELPAEGLARAFELLAGGASGQVLRLGD